MKRLSGIFLTTFEIHLLLTPLQVADMVQTSSLIVSGFSIPSWFQVHPAPRVVPVPREDSEDRCPVTEASFGGDFPEVKDFWLAQGRFVPTKFLKNPELCKKISGTTVLPFGSLGVFQFSTESDVNLSSPGAYLCLCIGAFVSGKDANS